MTKTEAVLRSLSQEPQTLKQIQRKTERRPRQIVGRQDLYTLIGVMRSTGRARIRVAGRGRDRTYALESSK